MRVRVEPFEDVEVEVNVKTLGAAYVLRGGRIAYDLRDLEVLWGALEEGWTSLRVFALREYARGVDLSSIPKRSMERVEGSADHQELCALARVYLEKLGNLHPMWPSFLAYAGGGFRADVAGRSLFVECGTLSGGFSKVIAGLSEQFSMMLVPYGLGCRALGALPLVPDASVSEVARKLRRKGRADLAYVFKPSALFTRDVHERLGATRNFRLGNDEPIVQLAADRARRVFRDRHAELLNQMHELRYRVDSTHL